jgi:hypothetical protein
MTVWLVEDDHEQAQDIKAAILQHVPDCQVEIIGAEQKFRNRFDEVAAGAADSIIVMDMILRWDDSSPTMKPRPNDVKEGGADRAGLRCAEMLRSHPRTVGIPIIFYSVLGPVELPASLCSRGGKIWCLEKAENHDALGNRIASTVKTYFRS